MKDTKIYTLLNAKAASGISNAIDVSDFMHQLIQLFFNGFTGTIKVQGSISEDCPDFSSARSTTNRWEYIQTVDLQSGSSIAGDTGVPTTLATDVNLLEVNVNGLKWLCVEVTRSAGSVSAEARLFNNK